MLYQAKNEPGDTIGAWYKFGCKNGDKFTVSLIISTLTTELYKALGALKFKLFGSFRRVFSGIVFRSASLRGFRFISRFGRLLFNSLRIRFRRITRFDAVRRLPQCPVLCGYDIEDVSCHRRQRTAGGLGRRIARSVYQDSQDVHSPK